MRVLELFAGAGGGILGGMLLGHRCVGAVEINPYCRGVLAARQANGSLPAFPVFSDIRAFDARPYRGRADIVAGGFPCQDISVAGSGKGIEGERSGLWREMARVVGEVRPRFVFVENSPALVIRGLGVVLGDLAALGYDCRWQVLYAADCGAPHRRERIWILGHLPDPDGERRAKERACIGTRGRDAVAAGLRGPFPDASGIGLEGVQSTWSASRPVDGSGDRRDFPGWPAEPGVGRVVDGMAHRVDRIVALGNGQVPRVAAAAFAMLAAEFGAEVTGSV